MLAALDVQREVIRGLVTAGVAASDLDAAMTALRLMKANIGACRRAGPPVELEETG